MFFRPLPASFPSRFSIMSAGRRDVNLRERGGVAIRWVAGMILVAAALLKRQAGPVEGFGLVGHHLLITVELALALLLMTGASGKWTLRVGAAAFSMFAAVAVGKYFAGATSCGCFGRIEVPPLLTATLDAALAAAFVAAERERPVVMRYAKWRALGFVAGSFLLLGQLITQVIGHPSDASLNLLGEFDGQTVYLQPNQWAGKPFFLSTLIDGGVELERGRWVVLFYQDGCSTCEAALPRYRAAAAMANDPLAPKHALVALIPANAGFDTNWAQFSATLPARYKWFAETPIVVGLIDGQVVYAAGGGASLDPAVVLKSLRVDDKAK